MSEDSNLNLTGVFPKYSAANKTAGAPAHIALAGNMLLPDATRGSADIYVLVTALDYDINRAVFFRSSRIEHPHWARVGQRTSPFAEAIYASTNAPVSYFDKPAEFGNSPKRYWDGAIAGCNNPVLAAVADATGKDQDPMNFAMLSIGTGLVECRLPALVSLLHPTRSRV